MDNAGYLFAAFAIVWLVVFSYIFVLLSREKKLRREIETLKETLKVKEAK